MKTKLIVGLAVTTVVLAAPTAAYGLSVTTQPAETRMAAGGFKEMGKIATTGASWRGRYRFLPSGKRTRGAFHFKGTLRVTDKNNGAKLEVRVAGYSHTEFRASRGSSKNFDELVFDGAAQRTNDAWVKICRDRGSLIPDNCSKERYYSR